MRVKNNYPWANYNLSDIEMPVKVDRLAEELLRTKFDPKESEFLVQGFTKGFDLCYMGPQERRDVSQNIPLNKEIGTEVDVWEKMIKEVKLNRFVGPFERIPFQHYIQSPVGLVPKSGNQCRLIFHLSYDFRGGGVKSVNYYIPQSLCSVKYKDIDHAVQSCLGILNKKTGATLWFGITDLKSAFRLVPLRHDMWMLLVMKARDPDSKRWRYFVDKCLPFGAAISCAIFQRFSNALAHILNSKVYAILYKGISNYLDDFLKVATTRTDCEKILTTFHELCGQLGVPLALEKVIWSTTRVVFLGILLDGKLYLLALPAEKIDRAVYLLKLFLSKKKAMVKQIQKLAGLLNFLQKAICPGRAFTRRMYAKISVDMTPEKRKLLLHHHVSLDKEFRSDCLTWLHFLTKSDNEITKFCRPFMDLDKVVKAEDLRFFTDSSACETLGFGGVCQQEWFWGKWEPWYINTNEPSIAYLELYAVCIGLYIWSHKFANLRILLHCDNLSVVAMINKTTSGCK